MGPCSSFCTACVVYSLLCVLVREDVRHLHASFGTKTRALKVPVPHSAHRIRILVYEFFTSSKSEGQNLRLQVVHVCGKHKEQLYWMMIQSKLIMI